MSKNSPYKIRISTSGTFEIIDITTKVQNAVNSSGVKDGVCYVYVPHTTAAVTINENADRDVKSDFLKGMDEIVPDLNYDHMEGNSRAHIMTSLIGNSSSILLDNGNLILGTWQGIYFCEFDGPGNRHVIIKIISG